MHFLSDRRCSWKLFNISTFCNWSEALRFIFIAHLPSDATVLYYFQSSTTVYSDDICNVASTLSNVLHVDEILGDSGIEIHLGSHSTKKHLNQLSAFLCAQLICSKVTATSQRLHPPFQQMFLNPLTCVSLIVHPQ